MQFIHMIRVLILSLVACTQALGQADALVGNLRQELFYSDFDNHKSIAFYHKIVSIKEKSPIIKAYEGAAIALKAHYAWNPLSKLSYIKQSNETLSKAIEQDLNNVEMRFLRLYIQNQTPKYLGFSENLQEDKEAILKNFMDFDLSALGQDIVSYILGYMKTSGLCSKKELEAMQKFLTYRAN